jgi:hypothetical protein
MILADIDTRHFSFQVFANNEQQGKNLLERAWAQHCVQYPDADPELWAELWEDARITQVVCGAVLRDHTIMFRDKNGGQYLDVAVLSEPKGYTTLVGDPEVGNVAKDLQEYARKHWDEFEDLPPIAEVPEEDLIYRYFEESIDHQDNFLVVNDTIPVVLP